MKLKFADRPNWTRIIKKRYVQKYVRDHCFEGYISWLFLDEVKEPLTMKYGSQEICIADDGYFWLMFFPNNKHHSLTVMINEQNKVMQWYFDIVKSIKLTDEGIPVIEDLYLDLVVLPNEQYYILDEDELDAALEEGAMNRNDYKLAVDELEKLRMSVERGENVLLNNTDRYMKAW
ncbi:Protein of uncharacterised function (DUF402) [Chlamydia abortus]|uniref:DUF402 domain-containing protein n=1 Tax=Paenibacillus residui TaxID=629724 RepID=A0ABW3DGD2_9BACL|nr:Protein of uncharacterised function (DUF402) [Chlamydia abortus]